MEIAKHVGSYKEILLLPKEIKKKKIAFMQKKSLKQILRNCYLPEIQYKITTQN